MAGDRQKYSFTPQSSAIIFPPWILKLTRRNFEGRKSSWGLCAFRRRLTRICKSWVSHDFFKIKSNAPLVIKSETIQRSCANRLQMSLSPKESFKIGAPLSTPPPPTQLESDSIHYASKALIWSFPTPCGTPTDEPGVYHRTTHALTGARVRSPWILKAWGATCLREIPSPTSPSSSFDRQETGQGSRTVMGRKLRVELNEPRPARWRPPETVDSYGMTRRSIVWDGKRTMDNPHHLRTRPPLPWSAGPTRPLQKTKGRTHSTLYWLATNWTFSETGFIDTPPWVRVSSHRESTTNIPLLIPCPTL